MGAAGHGWPSPPRTCGTTPPTGPGHPGAGGPPSRSAMTDLIGDPTLRALGHALSGLSLRQRTIADNVANVDTPQFLAGRVDFESSLLAAISDGEDAGAAPVATE